MFFIIMQKLLNETDRFISQKIFYQVSEKDIKSILPIKNL